MASGEKKIRLSKKGGNRNWTITPKRCHWPKEKKKQENYPKASGLEGEPGEKISDCS